VAHILRRNAGQMVRPRVLVVEDDAATREMLVDFLGLEGFAVEHAPNGLVALDRVQAHRPHVILLDLLMPVMDGPTFAATYRTVPGPHAPLIVMTASPSLTDTLAAIQPAAVLHKPFEIADLRAVLDQVLGH